MEKLIILPKEERKKLCGVFRVPDPVISQSVTFLRNGDIHQRIRLAAMRNGGKLLVECDEWNVEMLKSVNS